MPRAPLAAAKGGTNWDKFKPTVSTTATASGKIPACRTGLSGKLSGGMYGQVCYGFGCRGFSAQLIEWDFKSPVSLDFELTYEKKHDKGKIGVELGGYGDARLNYAFYVTWSDGTAKLNMN